MNSEKMANELKCVIVYTFDRAVNECSAALAVVPLAKRWNALQQHSIYLVFRHTKLKQTF